VPSTVLSEPESRSADPPPLRRRSNAADAAYWIQGGKDAFYDTLQGCSVPCANDTSVDNGTYANCMSLCMQFPSAAPTPSNPKYSSACAALIGTYASCVVSSNAQTASDEMACERDFRSCAAANFGVNICLTKFTSASGWALAPPNLPLPETSLILLAGFGAFALLVAAMMGRWYCQQRKTRDEDPFRSRRRSPDIPGVEIGTEFRRADGEGTFNPRLTDLRITTGGNFQPSPFSLRLSTTRQAPVAASVPAIVLDDDEPVLAAIAPGFAPPSASAPAPLQQQQAASSAAR
jgi:hypothetical protein